MSFIVVIYDGDYPDGKGSSCTLLGSYLSRRAARFISEAYRRRNKVDFYPKIIESEVPPDDPQAYILEENLKNQKDNIEKKQKKYKEKKYFRSPELQENSEE